jgi:hypothetical protein
MPPRYSAQLRDILALRDGSLRQCLLDIVAPSSSKAQAAPQAALVPALDYGTFVVFLRW